LSTLLEVLAHAVADIHASGVRCALVGGLAVGVRAYERTTRDVDLVVACADDDAAEALVRELRTRGYGVAQILEHVGTGRISTLRLTSKTIPRTFVDLLIATTGVEAEIIEGAEPLEVGAGVTCAVARTGHLVAMKVLSSSAKRPRDAEDLRELLRAISGQDLALARDTARRIDEAGLHPTRSVVDDLERVLATQGD
jgi:hypothetical protein